MFEVGQRVRVRHWRNLPLSVYVSLQGKTGEISSIASPPNLCRVFFKGEGLLFWDDELELVKEEGA